MKRMEEFIRELFTPGTPQFGFVCGILGAALGLMLLLLGFWKTLFVAFFCALGAYIGGVGDKQAHFKRILNGLFPPKNKQ